MTPQGLTEYARELGIVAVTRDDARFGRSTWAHTPWHDKPVRLVDQYDAIYLAAELAWDADRKERAA